ncbi:alpha/beta fold hydrolase [Rhodoferax sp.]|uniref:alpha/beta hydrolase n=1 Tax=Rhodoferax sp. TaxID=50421 RepID=UPI002610BCA1|nr:alpha/beta fold hydrolase [Rhodoferax sp.]MDD5479135.1 alpha/beta fold hydrolase [Rhodoferax sp.]
MTVSLMLPSPLYIAGAILFGIVGYVGAGLCGFGYVRYVSWTFGVYLALVPVVVFLALQWLRRELTPARLAHPDASDVVLPTPQHLRIPTQNQRTLFAQWLPQTPLKQTLGTVVLMHGWGGNGSQLMPAARELHAQGWRVLLPDARCHGLSDADTFSSLPRFAEDIDAALNWLLAHEATSQHRLVVLGHSVGAAAAILCASRRTDVSAVVSVSAFAHPEQVMQRWLAQYRIPFWPVGWLVNRYVEHVIGHRFNDIAPVSRIGLIGCPVLLVHGNRDKVVPLDCALRLRDAGAHATLLEVAGSHDSFDTPEILYQQVSQWLCDTRDNAV